MLLVINKVTVEFVPLPGFILFAQMGASVLYVKAMEGFTGVEVEKFERSKVLQSQVLSCELLCCSNHSRS